MAEQKIKITGDNKDFKRAAADTKQTINTLISKTSQMIGTFFGVRSVINVLGAVVNRFDAIAKSARSIGIGVEKFQEYAFAARRNNMELGRFSQALQKMQRTIDDAGDGMSTSMITLDKMGLSYAKLAHLDPAGQFEATIDALIGVEDATKRVALANELFGRAGRMMLNMGREYKTLGAEARSFGGILDSEVVGAAEDAKDALEGLKTAAFASVGKSWIEDLADALKLIVKLKNDIAKSGWMATLTEPGGTSQDFARATHQSLFDKVSAPGDLFGTKGMKLTNKAVRVLIDQWIDSAFGSPANPTIKTMPGAGPTSKEDIRLARQKKAEDEAIKRRQSQAEHDRRLRRLKAEEALKGGGYSGSVMTMGQILAKNSALNIGGHQAPRPGQVVIDAGGGPIGLASDPAVAGPIGPGSTVAGSGPVAALESMKANVEKLANIEAANTTMAEDIRAIRGGVFDLADQYSVQQSRSNASAMATEFNNGEE